MDLRLKQLSYSSTLTLHSCPREYQLYKLNGAPKEESEEEELPGTITFAFGHVVGEGIQNVFLGLSEEEIIFKAFLQWDTPSLFDADVKRQKDFWLAVLAIQKFIALKKSGFLDDYELVFHEDAPAVELGFAIHFPEGFTYRGYVDAVLRHKKTGKIVVLECKTTAAANLNAAQYKNSAQAVGYSVVLDELFPTLSAYDVFYLVYKTKVKEWELFPFPKSYLQRALWIQELLLDIETLKLYESAGVYPMRGESCLRFYRECGYYGLCTLSTAHLTKEWQPEMEEGIKKEHKKYQVQLSIQDLIARQLEKAET